MGRAAFPHTRTHTHQIETPFRRVAYGSFCAEIGSKFQSKISNFVVLIVLESIRNRIDADRLADKIAKQVWNKAKHQSPNKKSIKWKYEICSSFCSQRTQNCRCWESTLRFTIVRYWYRTSFYLSGNAGKRTRVKKI